MSKATKIYSAYLKDGTQINFTHAVDYSSALNAGMSANPPGVPEKPKAKVVVEEEKAVGIESYKKPEPIVSELSQEPITEEKHHKRK